MKSDKKPLVVIDADAIIALAHTEDKHHTKSKSIKLKLHELEARVIYPVTAIIEATTYIQRALNNKVLAYKVALEFIGSDNVMEINDEIYSHAVDTYFSVTAGKKNTLFDCIVASVADKYSADAVFSFDNFYKKQGFKLAEEL